ALCDGLSGPAIRRQSCARRCWRRGAGSGGARDEGFAARPAELLARLGRTPAAGAGGGQWRTALHAEGPAGLVLGPAARAAHQVWRCSPRRRTSPRLVSVPDATGLARVDKVTREAGGRSRG